MLRPLFMIALIPACLTTDDLDEPEHVESSNVALEETVLQAPTPRASCIAGCVGGFGSMVTIMTSYYGKCSQWGDVYECQAQPYTVTFACIGAPCTIAATSWSAWDASTKVTPTAPGLTGIRVRMLKSVGSDYNPIEVLDTIITPQPAPVSSADRIEFYCNDGDGEPCVAGPNKPPVYHYFWLMAGTQRVQVPAPGFDLVATASGTAGSLNTSWTTAVPGIQTVRVRYGNISMTRTFDVDYSGPRGLVPGSESEIDPIRN